MLFDLRSLKRTCGCALFVRGADQAQQPLGFDGAFAERRTLPCVEPYARDLGE